jgi:hypothetical protein
MQWINGYDVSKCFNHRNELIGVVYRIRKNRKLKERDLFNYALRDDLGLLEGTGLEKLSDAKKAVETNYAHFLKEKSA